MYALCLQYTQLILGSWGLIVHGHNMRMCVTDILYHFSWSASFFYSPFQLSQRSSILFVIWPKKHVILYHTGNRFFSICPWYSQLSSQKPNLICLQVPPCSLTFQDLLPYSRADSRSCYEVPCCKVLALRCLTVMSMLQGALL